MKLLAPAYGYPSQTRALWDGLVECADLLGHVIINPGSGPGMLRDPVWRKQIGILEERGVPMLGYLDLGYSGKPVDVILTEASRWQDWYGILDFFLDCAPSSDLLRSARVVDVLRMAAGAGILVANAGTTVVPAVADHFDAVVEHEGHADAGAPSAVVPIVDEVRQHRRGEPVQRPNRSWIVYGADQDSALRTLRRARAQGVDQIWVTDLDGGNPYRDLPSYWPWLVGIIAEEPSSGSFGS